MNDLMMNAATVLSLALVGLVLWWALKPEPGRDDRRRDPALREECDDDYNPAARRRW